MTAAEAQELVLQRLGMRVGPETGAYVARRLDVADAGGAGPIPVMGTDARTGIPLRRFLEVRAVADASVPCPEVPGGGGKTES